MVKAISHDFLLAGPPDRAYVAGAVPGYSLSVEMI